MQSRQRYCTAVSGPKASVALMATTLRYPRRRGVSGLVEPILWGPLDRLDQKLGLYVRCRGLVEPVECEQEPSKGSDLVSCVNHFPVMMMTLLLLTR